jgi:predicted  nucleic acid-binding Zn-ribbon protein
MVNTDVTKMSFFAVTDPKLITVDFNQLEHTQKDRREQMVKLNPPKPEGPAKELSRLRGQLFDLKQAAQAFEQRTRDAAGNSALLEQRITEAIKKKKTAVADGNLRGERTYERHLQQLEIELADAQEEHTKHKNWSAQTARALKAFDGHERIAELTLLLDAPLSEAKK